MHNKLDKKEAFKAQHVLMIFKLLSEILGFICLVIAAVVSESMVLGVDLVDSINIMLITVFVLVLSGKLGKNVSFQYNYGTGKVEAFVSLCCDTILLISLAIATVMAVNDILYAEQPNDLPIWIILLKIINVAVDAYVLLKQKKIKTDSKVHRSEFAAIFKDLLFDGSVLIVLIVTDLLRDATFSWYISPICSLGLVALTGCYTVLRMRAAVIDLVDITCDEKTQKDVIKVLVSLYDQYDEFLEVKSRMSGEQLFVNIYLSFNPETTFEQIEQFTKTASEKLRCMNPNIVLSVVICED